MSDQNDPIEPDDLDPIEGADSAGYETEPPEIEDDAPRRAASARFIVDSEVGSAAAMRDAMDPANQSLADALRLSYRVLQLVMLVLLALFLISGYKTVEQGQSGVRTVWGKIANIESDPVLEPGAQFSFAPYPIGEFVLFEAENRSANIGDVFAPPLAGFTEKEKLERSDMHSALTPGRFGSLITRDGDIGHLEIKANYSIADPVAFVKLINDADAKRDGNKIVKLALQRAAVHTAATLTLQEIADASDDTKLKIQTKAQEVLDGLRCGIQLEQTPQQMHGYAPYAIQKSNDELATAQVMAGNSIVVAQRMESETQSAMAGPDYKDLIALIGQYEDSLERNDEAQSTDLLNSINTKLESASGQVSQIIGFAKTYRSQVESTLGNEQRRFESLLPAYRENPQLLVKQQWLDTITTVMNHRDTEVLFVPASDGRINLGLSGSQEIAEIRRKNDMARRAYEAQIRAMDPLGRALSTAKEMRDNAPGRTLTVDENAAPGTVKLKPTGAP